MSARVHPPDTAFAGPKQRRPRVKNDKHLDFIRSLPCLVCGEPNKTEAAHIRMAAPSLGKRETGKSEKPNDEFTVPMCNSCHRWQHGMGEWDFWKIHCRAVIGVALALWAATGDYERGCQIIKANR